MIRFEKNENPNGIFDYFLEISKVPRGSGNTAGIADYLVEFADKHGLVSIRDKKDNVIIKKGATAGYEARPTVILQGHTDIVAEKTPGLAIDMTTDALDVYRDGDWLRARGTTLGGDDGVALAYALALLASNDIPHPAIEAVFTSDEEIGLIGASALDCSVLEGKTLINIDSDEEGIFTVGCAGGGRVDIALDVKREAIFGKGYKLTVSGLLGGHSGVEIHKGRSNAIKVGTDVLSALGDIRLCSFTGGNLDNAICREFTATFTAEQDITALFNESRNNQIALAAASDPGITISLEACEVGQTALDGESTKKVLSLFGAIKTGVIAMSADIEGLVETSENMGVARLDGTRCTLTVSVRSSKKDSKAQLIEYLRSVAVTHGAEISVRGEYPAWEYRADSHLRDVAVEVYRETYGKEPVVVAIHAGLECGIFSDAIEGLDCISIGPDNHDIHTTEEHLSISSTVRVWEFLLKVLARI
jgi:dipeptidase D